MFAPCRVILARLLHKARIGGVTTPNRKFPHRPGSLLERNVMTPSNLKPLWRWLPVIAACGLVSLGSPSATQTQPTAGQEVPKRDVGKSSYDQIAPVLTGQESFATMMAKDKAGKAKVMARQQALLEERY